MLMMILFLSLMLLLFQVVEQLHLSKVNREFGNTCRTLLVTSRLHLLLPMVMPILLQLPTWLLYHPFLETLPIAM